MRLRAKRRAPPNLIEQVGLVGLVVGLFLKVELITAGPTFWRVPLLRDSLGGLRADGVPGWRRAVLLFRASARGGLRVYDANRRPTTSSAPATAAWASRVFPPFPAEAASGPSGSGPRRRLAAAFECTMLVGARRRPARPPRRRGSPSSGGHRYPPLTAGQLVVLG